jgi:high-affinity Fe2+/Pb2+ permease
MLDSKASQLTSANSLLLAVSLFFYGYVGASGVPQFRWIMSFELGVIVVSMACASLVTFPRSEKKATRRSLDGDGLDSILQWMVSRDAKLIASKTILLQFAYAWFWGSVAFLIVAVLGAFGVLPGV